MSEHWTSGWTDTFCITHHSYEGDEAAICVAAPAVFGEAECVWSFGRVAFDAAEGASDE